LPLGTHTAIECDLLKIKVVDVSDENVDDALLVCPPTRTKLRGNENVKKGLEIRKNWLLDLYGEIGPCAKVAYLDNEPVGMIQYTPLHKIPYFKTKRRDVLYIHCIYVKRNVRNRGIGSALLKSLLDDTKNPSKLFEQRQCRMLSTTARKRYGFTQVSYFKTKGFIETGGNIDAGLVYPLSKTDVKESLDTPRSELVRIQEEGVKIFFNPSCHMCKYMNENIKANIREVNATIEIEECNLWTHSEEAIRRGLTSVATYVNGKAVLPMPPEEFWKTIKRLSLETEYA
jgi:GNAT superfamily N-acetyltransferase